MGIRQIFKISRKTFFNPSLWVDWNYVKFENRTLFSILKTQFTPTRPQREESFEQAMKRLNLTEEDVKKTATSYRYYALFFFILGFLSFIYAFFLLFSRGFLSGWILSLAVCLLLLSQAFRFDFWAFQMKNRTLGLTFADWKQHYLGDKGKRT